ncbi:retrovirus-related pol polyprotein from transposon TNT 1-94 [Tanacetum coccineum]|uniref:Retrovirus-related pol polyprotein from transposon TNT 1-94 n=1 Tax=Tanacetum coccineum TaxID=301880 RepID=A0ABQ5FVD0_9ASTR
MHPPLREASRTLQLQRSTKESRAPQRTSTLWNKAIIEEMVSLEKNQTWSLVRLSAGKKALQSKWVFKVKEEHDGKKRYKDRLVVKGFQHKQGVHYNEIFSPVVKMTTIRLVLSIVAAEDLHLEQLDVKTTFLHSDLDEDIYMTQQRVVSQIRLGIVRCAKMTIVSRIRDEGLGPASIFLAEASSVLKTKGTLRLSQEKYMGKVLDKFNMKDADARCQPLGDHFKLSKKQAPKTEASRRRKAKEAVKWLLRYLKGTSKATLCFSRKEVVLEGFSDSDYEGYLDSGKSTTGYVFTVGGTTVSWMSKIQKCVEICQYRARVYGIEEAGRVCEGTLSLKKILGAKNLADMLTKVVTTEKLKLYASLTGLRDN